MAGAALPACANAPSRSPMPPLRPERTATGALVSPATALIERAGLTGQVGYAVADARTGRLLEAHEPDVGRPPASVVKALTALHARAALGAGHRFVTRLVATGPVSGGTVSGDLVLLGGGDPTLSTDGLAVLADALRARGITGVSGRFLVNGSALPAVARIDPDQPDHVGYNPAVSGLNLNYNRVHFRWRRAGAGHEVVMDAPGDRNNARVSIATMTVQGRQTPVYTYADAGGTERWTVAASALGREGSRWLPTRHPELYAGDVFRSLARARGITLPAAQRAGGAAPGTVLAEHASAPLDRLLTDMLRWSTNLTAEAVGMAATLALGGRPANLAQSAGLMSAALAQRHGVAGLRLVDHSGLGPAARMSPAQMVQLLCAPGVSGAMRGLLRDHPMRDGQGNVIRNHALDVAAKTGTLNFVSGLAGYVTAPSGNDLAFAIFSADLTARNRLTGDQRERPPGGQDWTRRARTLQQALIERWGAVHA